jgi:hypothetical protein
MGFMMLMMSCTSRDTIVDKTKLLGADYRLFQETPAWELAKAVEDGDVEKIRLEISKDKKLVNFRESRFGQPLLILAVYHTNYTSVKTLLEEGANPNLQDSYYGDSALMEAVKIGSGTDDSDPRFLKLLLKYGGNPNEEQQGSMKTRDTPLLIACSESKFDYIKILVDAGAKVNVVNEYGICPLYWAMLGVESNGDPEIITYLIQKGADFRRVLYKTIPAGVPKYITDALRQWRFEIGSLEYKKKMQIVEFLKINGIDYRKAAIPEQYKKDYPKDYLEKY